MLNKGSMQRPLTGGAKAVQAMGCVFHGKENYIAIGAGFARMHDIGGNVDHRAGLGLDRLAADGCVKGALENVNPLFIGMRMRFGASAGWHAHQSDDHAVALDASALRGRIIGAAKDVIDLGRQGCD